jgi:hypothetical protein
MTHLDHGPERGALLTDRLHDELDPLHAPSTLAPAALRGGRRLRRRRRATGAAGAIALATAAAVLVLPGGGPGGSTATDPASPAAPSVPRAETLRAAPAPVAGPPRGWFDMPSTELVARLESLLPDDVDVVRLFPSDRAPGEPDRGAVSGLLDDGSGPGTFQVLTYAAAPADGIADGIADAEGPGLRDEETRCDDEAFTSGMDGDLHRPTTCRVITDPDGRPVGRVVVNAPETPEGSTLREVTVRHGQGYVYVFSTNTAEPKMDTTTLSTAPQPPLTVAELRDIATSTSWTSWTPPSPPSS